MLLPLVLPLLFLLLVLLLLLPFVLLRSVFVSAFEIKSVFLNEYYFLKKGERENTSFRAFPSREHGSDIYGKIK